MLDQNAYYTTLFLFSNVVKIFMYNQNLGTCTIANAHNEIARKMNLSFVYSYLSFPSNKNDKNSTRTLRIVLKNANTSTQNVFPVFHTKLMNQVSFYLSNG